MKTDILYLLDTNPHEGMVKLINTHTGILWKVASCYLSDPETIKEVVNDTFSEFYFHRDRYQPEKSNLSTYLAAITRNLAISRYRNDNISEKTDMEIPFSVTDKQLENVELHMDLQKAISSLHEKDQQIIFMKYYNGMTINEIAASLNLPYETVKKRHQRSLGKLRRYFLLTLLIGLLLLLSSCAYYIFETLDLLPPYFPKIFTKHNITEEKPDPDNEDTEYLHNIYMPRHDPQTDEFETNAYEPEIDTPGPETDSVSNPVLHPEEHYTYVPQYGIHTNTVSPAYVLYEDKIISTDNLSLTLNDANYIDKILRLSVTAYTETKDALGDSNAKLYYGDKVIQLNTTTYKLDNNLYQYEFSIKDETLAEYMTGEISLELFSLKLSFQMVSAKEETISGNYYQMEEYGGIFAIPRIENGSLIIAIHPLNHGNYSTLPALIKGFFGEHENGEIYVTSETGKKYTGNCIKYRPYNFLSYYEWNFGSAPAGKYTLHIPYLYQSCSLPDDFQIPVNLENLNFERTPLPIPDGSISLEECTLLNPLPGESIGGSQTVYTEDNTNTYWKILLNYNSSVETHTILDVNLTSSCDKLPDNLLGELSPGEVQFLYSKVNTIIGSSKQEVVISANGKWHDFSSFSLIPRVMSSAYKDNILYRWNQSFDLTFTVTE